MKKEIIKTAREWIDTPYHHQARLRGVGVDCIGLVIGVCWELKLIDFDYNNYNRTPDSTMMMQIIQEHCTSTDTPEAGDLLVFRIRRNPQHCGLMTDTGIIHAYESVGKVVEHPLDKWWSDRIVGSFILPLTTY